MQSNHKMHALKHALVGGGADGHIDARRFQAAVAEKIREIGEILFQCVKGAREQMAQVVRKHLGRF